MTKNQKPRRAALPAKKGNRSSPMTAAELLLEIGVEELPYQFIAPALAVLKDSAEQMLKDRRLAFQAARTLGTPRRLTLVVEGLATQQTSMVKETMGPSKAVAFDQAGQPTRAATGFAAGQGVSVQDLQICRTPKGEYLFAVKQEQGRPANLVLEELLPQLIAKLSFPKAMKWNNTGVRFARPVRWLVALYGGATLPIEAAGITAGNRTEGHRVLGSAKGIVVRDSESYLKGLERQGVTPDPQRRRHMIEEQIATLCKETGFTLNVDGDLLDQAVYMTECPNAIIGSFKPAYLEVPQEILITSMKEHQGFFSLRHKETGKLVPHFIAVTNNRAKDMGLIREGNERVLAARLADAKFFYDKGLETPPADLVEKLRGVMFHQSLGTLYDKMERTEKLVEILTIDTGNHGVIDIFRRSARLANTDLLTAVVGEFPTLQGVMGGEYAKHAGEDPRISKAITEQYLPRGMEGAIPESLNGKLLSLADRLGKIAGFFRVGIVPKGSEDPYALRRDALSIVRILVEGDLPLKLEPALDKAEEILAKSNIKELKVGIAQGPFDFIVERLRYYAGTAGGIKRSDVIDAVLTPTNTHALSFKELLERMKALEFVTAKPEFDPLIVGFKRAHRLVEKEKNWVRQPVNPALFQHPSETQLREAWEKNDQLVRHLLVERKYSKVLEAFVSMKPAIDDFFTAVMVNADDRSIRINRLSLLKDIDDLFLLFADFSQIVVQGS